jgi:hypothetical protein
MKKIIAFVAITFALAGCSSYDHKACRDSVVRDVGTQDVAEVHSFRFVARDSKGAIWYYETMNQTDTEISKKQPVFSAQ